MVTRGGGGGINWEIGIDIYTLLHIKQTNNKDLMYSTGNSTQSSVMTSMGKESKKEWIYVYIKLIHFAVHLKQNIANQLYSNKNFKKVNTATGNKMRPFY